MPVAHCQTAAVSVSTNTLTLVVATALAGSAPFPVSDASTTYAVQSDTAGKKISAVLDAPLPPGMILEVEVAGPPGALSAGRVALSIAPQTVVYGVPAGQFSGLSINYYLTAATSAGVVPRELRSVTFTITP